MSVENNVFLRRDKMPTPKSWAAAIREHGFEMEMDTDFDAIKFEGFLPCKYKSIEAGFEYWAEDTSLDELHEEDLLNDDEKTELGDSNFLVTFATRSSFRDYMTSMIASAVLAELSEGYLAVAGEPPFIHGNKAVAWARDCGPDIEKEFD